MITHENSTEIDSVFTGFYLKLYIEKHMITRHYSARATNSQTNSHNFKKSNWIYLQ